ncbi:MAG: HD domain-containing protein [Candidatus Bathyarchaeota archaeon]|nr:HD domain-containing protein [Candidatus Bathyarchaeota archaeon]
MNIRLVDKALEFSSERHKGQLDDQGRPYFFAHIVQVHSILKDVTDDIETLCAGILHDIIEDTDTTYEELVHEFNKPIAELVKELTHKGNRENGYYFPYLESRKAVMVKFADRLSNLSRMDDWPGDRQQVYLGMSKFWKTELPGDKVASPNTPDPKDK